MIGIKQLGLEPNKWSAMYLKYANAIPEKALAWMRQLDNRVRTITGDMRPQWS